MGIHFKLYYLCEYVLNRWTHFFFFFLLTLENPMASIHTPIEMIMIIELELCMIADCCFAAILCLHFLLCCLTLHDIFMMTSHICYNALKTWRCSFICVNVSNRFKWRIMSPVFFSCCCWADVFYAAVFKWHFSQRVYKSARWRRKNPKEYDFK